ncbi:MAG: hypothetical protein P8X42_00190 [Calditrichaceae bacterium]
MKVRIISSKRVLDDFFQVDDVRLQHEKFSGSLTRPIRRLNLERGEAVAVLIYLRDKDYLYWSASFVMRRTFHPSRVGLMKLLPAFWMKMTQYNVQNANVLKKPGMI